MRVARWLDYFTLRWNACLNCSENGSPSSREAAGAVSLFPDSGSSMLTAHLLWMCLPGGQSLLPLPSFWCASSICFSIPLQGRKEEQLCRGSWSLRPKPQVVGKSQCQFPELGTRNAHMVTHTCTRWPGLCPSETWDDTSRCGMLGRAGCPCYPKSSQW